VFQLLPPERVTAVRARPIAASETEVARSDAVIFVVDETRWARSLAALPFASVWTRLDKRRGGYRKPKLWLSDGWDWIKREAIERPLYWHDDGSHFTLAGRREIDRAAPVAHASYYEADAFARWAGARLPTEAEWEDSFAFFDAEMGHQLDGAGPVIPKPGGGPFGDVWQWTQSAYLPYPGFKPEAGAVGEYNGKFMSGQMVLKGASCATPRGHSRASYRNFFPPAARWQFTGVRLAQDA